MNRLIAVCSMYRLLQQICMSWNISMSGLHQQISACFMIFYAQSHICMSYVWDTSTTIYVLRYFYVRSASTNLCMSHDFFMHSIGWSLYVLCIGYINKFVCLEIFLCLVCINKFLHVSWFFMHRVISVCRMYGIHQHLYMS